MITSPIGTTAPSRSANTPNQNSDTNNAITNAAGGTMGKDQFVQLLVTEMKNQDPMNPMDGKDLAAQLAQFSSVEQLMNINTKLDNFTTMFTSTPPTSGSDTSSTQGA